MSEAPPDHIERAALAAYAVHLQSQGFAAAAIDTEWTGPRNFTLHDIVEMVDKADVVIAFWPEGPDQKALIIKGAELSGGHEFAHAFVPCPDFIGACVLQHLVERRVTGSPRKTEAALKASGLRDAVTRIAADAWPFRLMAAP